MKNLIVLLVTMNIIIMFNFNSMADGKEKEIIIENRQFKLIIGSNATAKSLVLKATNEECLMPGENLPVFSATQERPYNNEVKLSHLNMKHTFQADTIYRQDDKLIVGFETIPYKAVFHVKIAPQYIRFSLEDFIFKPEDYPSYMKMTPPPATEICLLQLPVKNMKNFGEWLNVSWDDNVSVNVLATDEYAQIDSESRNGYRIMKANVVKDIKLKGAGAALIVCETKNLLDNVAQVEEDFNLPRGVKSRRNELINASYLWTYTANLQNIDEVIQYAKKGGFRCMMLYYPCFLDADGYKKLGNYKWDKTKYPNGKEDLIKMLNKIKSAGITPGFHFLHSHIGLDSKYITPVPDYRLNLVKTFNLAENLGITDTTIFVEQNPEGLTMADDCRVLKVGTELISYKKFTTTWPYKFSGCVRGIDKTTVNSLPRGYTIGLLDVSEFGATSVYIDQRTSLQDEIAEKIANIYDAGFQFVYFDGSEGVNPPFGYNVPLAQYRVFRRLKPEPIFAEGAAKSHFSWHMLSGGNAFDQFSPEYQKEAIRKHPAEEAPRMQKDFTRINFGWLGYWRPSSETIGTQPDILEYVTSRAAAWDCPISMCSLPEQLAGHARTADNLEVLRRWEEVRAQHWLTETQKKMLQNLNQEHLLLLDEQKKFELVPYDQITDIANGSKEVRAFIFQRKGDYYVVYWHISGNKKLELPLNFKDVTLYKTLGQKENFTSTGNKSIIVPVSNRRYLKTKNITKEQLIAAFKNVKIVK